MIRSLQGLHKKILTMAMDRISFQNKIRKMIEKPSRLLALESDAKVIILPDSYKDFVSQYGGGYFGFIVVYSCDCNGMFYIKDNVLKEWVKEKSFLPVVDLETGDFLGFEIDFYDA